MLPNYIRFLIFHLIPYPYNHLASTLIPTAILIANVWNHLPFSNRLPLSSALLPYSTLKPFSSFEKGCSYPPCKTGSVVLTVWKIFLLYSYQQILLNKYDLSITGSPVYLPLSQILPFKSLPLLFQIISIPFNSTKFYPSMEPLLIDYS